ncbi:MAG: xanthine dehydrogenase family protein, partial [Pseudomonadota bacterium]
LTYRQLLQDSEISEEIVLAEPSRDTVQLFTRAPAASRRHIGQMVEQVGIHDVVTGQAQYSRDARLPDMRFGAVARPAQLGAELIAWDADKARQVAGVMAVVEGPDGTPGVVASTPGAAQRGVQALACKWRQLSADQLARVQENLDIDVLIDRNELEHKPIDNGSLASGREAAQIQLNERYDTPMAAHAAMEPRAGLAHFERRDGTAQCRVWTGSQDPWLVRKAVSRALGINDERVIVYNHRIGGAFGGRLLCQASIEAAWLSQAVGEPVKVQWSREEEFACNYVGPQFSTRIEAGLDDTGNIAYWHHRMAGAPILTSSTFIPRRLHWAADLVADPGTQRGTELPYAVTNQRVEFADVRVPMPTGAWRGLGAAPNTFAVEVAMDELASAAALEPLAFRAAHARDPRLAGVLKRLAELISDEDTPPGVAATAYKGVTFVAVAASVDVSSGLPVVTKLWCVHDCGQVVSPDQVLAQIEGNLVWGIGMALTEEFKLADGTPSTLNFDTYLPPRSLDIPPMQIEMIESDAPPSGAAEAAFAPVAAAIANAVSRATGARQRRLPLQPLAAPGRRQG